MARIRIYTRKGDSGTTGLLFGGERISKADLRTDAYGTTDEAVSALGLARAAIGSQTDRTEVLLADLILRLQRELFVVGAELATHTDRRERLTDGVSRVTAEMVTALEGEIDSLEELVEQPKEFVVPGESATGAGLDLARTTVRRAERRAVALAGQERTSLALEAQEVGHHAVEPRRREVRALGEQPVRRGARVLEVAGFVGDREAHVRRLPAHADAVEEALEARVVAVVEDDEAGVDPVGRVGGVDPDGVDVAAGPRGGLEHADLVTLVQEVGGDEPGLAFAEIDSNRTADVRRQLPSLANRRPILTSNPP